jgi:segregation and condensation protein B
MRFVFPNATVQLPPVQLRSAAMRFGHALSRRPDSRSRHALARLATQCREPSGADDPEDMLHRRQRLEAVMLMAREPLNSRKLAQFAKLADGTEARTLVRELNGIYDEAGRAFRVEEVAGGFRLLTRRQFAPWLRRLEHVPGEVRLSAPSMETLAVVAYRQPVLRAEIEAIRGVSCGEILRQLMERELVRIGGRSDELGRPYLYTTTRRFLQLFGLQSLEQLPRAELIRPDSDDRTSDTVSAEEEAPIAPPQEEKTEVITTSTIAVPVSEAFDEATTQESEMSYEEDEIEEYDFDDDDDDDDDDIDDDVDDVDDDDELDDDLDDDEDWDDDLDDDYEESEWEEVEDDEEWEEDDDEEWEEDDDEDLDDDDFDDEE